MRKYLLLSSIIILIVYYISTFLISFTLLAKSVINNDSVSLGGYINVKSLRENWTWSERQWSKATNDTGIGNPMKSTKEKGEKYFKDVCNKVSKLIQELCNANLKNLYYKN